MRKIAILLCLLISSGCSSNDVGLPGANCSASQTTCDGKCINAQTDKDNCGKCGKTCAAIEDCITGVCEVGGASCIVGETNCSGACFDLKTDASNCGACGKNCVSGEVSSIGIPR